MSSVVGLGVSGEAEVLAGTWGMECCRTVEGPRGFRSANGVRERNVRDTRIGKGVVSCAKGRILCSYRSLAIWSMV